MNINAINSQVPYRTVVLGEMAFESCKYPVFHFESRGICTFERQETTNLLSSWKDLVNFKIQP